MDELFERLKREVEEERLRIYAEKFETPPLEDQSLLDEHTAS
ncbi:MAG: hypothetical protein ACE5DM_02460 [Candidatus Nanoarchaeia archaeon]